MIIKEYDIGWGPEWDLKQLETEVVAKILAPHINDHSRSVVINSVWYTGDYHQQVIAELKTINPTHVFVVAMLDPPTVQLDWFAELGCNVTGIGYYPGPGFVDFFALAMDKFFVRPADDVLLNSSTIDTAFMCLNRKPHPHRVRLFNGIRDANLLDHGFVSLGGTPPVRVLENDCLGQEQLAPNGGSEQYGIGNDIATLGSINNWQRHFVNIVTETIWDIEPSGFFSEKTFKPILGLRPFLIYAPNGGVDCLTRRGFEPYVNDFDDLVDIDLKQPYNIPVFLRLLADQPVTYWQMKFKSLKEKLLYNRNQFEILTQQHNLK